MTRTTLPGSLVRWEPFSHLSDLRREMNRLFDWSLTRGVSESGENGHTVTWMPDVELIEQEDQYLVRMDVPGLKREDVDINLTSNVLTIQGERKSEQKRKDESVHVCECSYGRFFRRFTLPQEVDADKVHATMKDGVLEVRLTKTAESKARKIAIQS